METKIDCLTLDYLQTRLNQARRDVEMFTIMIAELRELQKNTIKLQTNNNFLQIVKNGKTV